MEFLPEIPSLLYTSCLVHPPSVMPCQHNSPPTLGPMALNPAQPAQPITCVQRLISTVWQDAVDTQWSLTACLFIVRPCATLHMHFSTTYSDVYSYTAALPQSLIILTLSICVLLIWGRVRPGSLQAGEPLILGKHMTYTSCDIN